MFSLASNDPQGFIMLRCECGQCKFTDHDLYDYEDGNKCIIMKNNTTITCDKCGKSQSSPENKYIIQETQIPASVVRHLPECPTCHSLDIEKIGTIKKYSSFAVMGVFSPNLGKQFHCRSCGYRF